MPNPLPEGRRDRDPNCPQYSPKLWTVRDTLDQNPKRGFTSDCEGCLVVFYVPHCKQTERSEEHPIAEGVSVYEDSWGWGRGGSRLVGEGLGVGGRVDSREDLQNSNPGLSCPQTGQTTTVDILSFDRTLLLNSVLHSSSCAFSAPLFAGPRELSRIKVREYWKSTRPRYSVVSNLKITNFAFLKGRNRKRGGG